MESFLGMQRLSKFISYNFLLQSNKKKKLQQNFKIINNNNKFKEDG